MAASHLADGMLGNIRAGRVRQHFAIPAELGMPEFVVDLSQEQPVPAAALVDLSRRASLSEDYWLRFLVHRFVYQSRVKPEDAFKEDLLP